MKKKHRKKKSKGRTSRKVARRPAHSSRAKPRKRREAHGESASHASSLLRAIKRRRAAEHGEHSEHSATRRPGPKRHKRAHGVARKPSHPSGEPVVTEKSFENMLAYRRFQNHAR